MNKQMHKFNNIRFLLLFSIVLFVFLAALSVSATTRNPVGDFDGDGKTDIAVFRPSDGYWYISKSSGGYLFVKWGLSTDTLVPGDYDGDGKTDLAVFRGRGINELGVLNHWYILRSSDFTFDSSGFGRDEGFERSRLSPPADYDGDGKTDLASITTIYANIAGSISIAATYFRVLQSTYSVSQRVLPNTFEATVVSADYDGDGKADFATFQDGIWTISQSSNGATRTVSFGYSNDALVPADYDGDGKVDIAVWRPSNGYWYWLSSRDGSFNSYKFGQSGDGAVPGDYDGDGRTDFAVVRIVNGLAVWYLQQSRDGFRAEQFGMSGDIAIPR